MRERHYTLGWMDSTVNATLNPAHGPVSEWDCQRIIQRAFTENRRQKAFLKKCSFSMTPKACSRLVIQYRIALLNIHNQAFAYSTQIDHQDSARQKATEAIIAATLDLLHFIEGFFGHLPIGNQLAAASVSKQVQNEIGKSIVHIGARLKDQIADQPLLDLILAAFGEATDQASQQVITLAQIKYWKKLISKLENLRLDDHPELNRQLLIKTLIKLNFNTGEFINYYIGRIALEINALENPEQRMDRLLFYLKEFRQLPHRFDIAIRPEYPAIEKIIGNWLSEEISYLKQKSEWRLAHAEQMNFSTVHFKQEPFKVLVLLSVDQIGLILRALDAIRIVKARSLNAVFQSIAPFLSTPRKQEISSDSMRSKSYNFEESDKQTVIKVLESVIDWIKQY